MQKSPEWRESNSSRVGSRAGVCPLGQPSLRYILGGEKLLSQQQKTTKINGPGARCQGWVQSVQPGFCMNEIVYGGTVLLRILSHLPHCSEIFKGWFSRWRHAGIAGSNLINPTNSSELAISDFWDTIWSDRNNGKTREHIKTDHYFHWWAG